MKIRTYKQYTIRFLLLLLFFLCTLFFPIISLAQSNQSNSSTDQNLGFTVIPPSQDIEVIPGQVINSAIKVYNVSDNNIVLEATAENFSASGTEGYVNINDDVTPFSIKDWIKIKGGAQVLKPREFANFEYTLSVPANVEPGSHWGAIVISTTKPNVDPQASQSVIKQSIGSLILLKAPGDVYEDAKIDSLSPEEDYFIYPKVKLNSIVENLGNVHVKVSGFYSIYDIFGNKVKTVELEGKNVLPGAKREFSSEFDFDLVGPYKVELALTYSGKTMTTYSNFWALYLDKTLKILGVIVITLILYLVLRKRINRAIKILLKGEKEK